MHGTVPALRHPQWEAKVEIIPAYCRLAARLSSRLTTSRCEPLKVLSLALSTMTASVLTVLTVVQPGFNSRKTRRWRRDAVADRLYDPFETHTRDHQEHKCVEGRREACPGFDASVPAMFRPNPLLSRLSCAPASSSSAAATAPTAAASTVTAMISPVGHSSPAGPTCLFFGLLLFDDFNDFVWDAEVFDLELSGAISATWQRVLTVLPRTYISGSLQNLSPPGLVWMTSFKVRFIQVSQLTR